MTVVVTVGLVAINKTLGEKALRDIFQVAVVIEMAVLGGAALSNMFHIAVAVEMTVQGICVIETHETTVQGVPVMICKMALGHLFLVLTVQSPIRVLALVGHHFAWHIQVLTFFTIQYNFFIFRQQLFLCKSKEDFLH